MIFDYSLYVFRQFIGGMCQKNQLKRQFMLGFNKSLYVEKVLNFCTYFQHKINKKRAYIKMMYALFHAVLTCLVEQHATDMTDRFCWIQAFRTYRHTVHNPFTTE